ncbi:IPTL-CTERM sorting domain-containing protein [Rhodoferax sp.]|uniref:IPTL-CTERM sorting domain-containing protein n=1 Tax=Rhodoferax sp. TaxID=50421 RepID=UPI0034549220
MVGVDAVTLTPQWPWLHRDWIKSCSAATTVPTLSEWGIVILMALLGITGFYQVRRRK